MYKLRFNLLSFSALKQFNAKSITISHKKVLGPCSKSEFFQLSRTNSTSSVAQIKKVMGQQNVFYFEESKLLKTLAADHSDYQKLRETIPVILLLGWTGAKDPHLKKYADIYSSMGYHTIRFSPSDYTSFLDEHKKFTYEMLQLMKNDYNMTKNPILVHTFSNACGFILYHNLINVMNKVYDDKSMVYSKEYDFFEKNEKGLIADSGFGWPNNIFDLTVGIYNLLENQVKIKPIRMVIATSVVALYNAYRLVHLGNDYFANAFRTILNDKRPLPILFMYSKIDKLISSTEIARFIAKKRQLFPSQYIKSVVYEDAEHVLLYAKYPDDYLKNIIEHIGVCNLDLKQILNKSNLYSEQIDSFLKNDKPSVVKSKL